MQHYIMWKYECALTCTDIQISCLKEKCDKNVFKIHEKKDVIEQQIHKFKKDTEWQHGQLWIRLEHWILDLSTHS